MVALSAESFREITDPLVNQESGHFELASRYRESSIGGRVVNISQSVAL